MLTSLAWMTNYDDEIALPTRGWRDNSRNLHMNKSLGKYTPVIGPSMPF